MHRSADVVVLGAGIMGASVAYHLAARGVKRILVLDRHPTPGGGSTARATGGFRAQHASEVNVRLSLLSREKLRRFRDELGVDPGYVPAGYLLLANSAEQLAVLRDALELQRSCGLHEATEVSPDDIARINPAVLPEGVTGGAYCPTDGFLRPLEMLRGYLEGAWRLGVETEFGTSHVGFKQDASGRIQEVLTTRGPVLAGQVVNAAGPWAAACARAAGVEIPVTPLARQVASTVPTDVLPADMPMTVFLADGFHLRVRDGRVLLLWPGATAAAADPFEAEVDAAWLDGLRARADARVPCLRAVPIDRDACWAGLYEMSPDHHALLGHAPEVENLYLINGSSGHGVMHSPALGQLLAEVMLDGRAGALDAHALRPSRFAEGRPNQAPSLL